MKKSICGYLFSCLIGVVAAGSVMFSMSVAAADLPLSCTTVNSKDGGNNYLVEAIVDPVTGEFPLTRECPPYGSGIQCTDFGYIVSTTSATVSHTLFAVQADYLIHIDPDLQGAQSESIADPGEGSLDGFLKYAMHEKAVRFNSNGTTFEAHILVEGDAVVGATTALVQGGKIKESCLIAGPGSVVTQGDVWQPITSSKNVNVLHGECDATLNYNPSGKLIGIDLPQASIDNGCITGQVPAGAKAAFGGTGTPEDGIGEIIQNANVPDGISFGDASTIMYLPSGWAICTEDPCPGYTTYVFTY